MEEGEVYQYKVKLRLFFCVPLACHRDVIIKLFLKGKSMYKCTSCGNKVRFEHDLNQLGSCEDCRTEKAFAAILGEQHKPMLTTDNWREQLKANGHEAEIEMAEEIFGTSEDNANLNLNHLDADTAAWVYIALEWLHAEVQLGIVKHLSEKKKH